MPNYADALIYKLYCLDPTVDRISSSNPTTRRQIAHSRNPVPSSSAHHVISSRGHVPVYIVQPA